MGQPRTADSAATCPADSAATWGSRAIIDIGGGKCRCGTEDHVRAIIDPGIKRSSIQHFSCSAKDNGLGGGRRHTKISVFGINRTTHSTASSSSDSTCGSSSRHTAELQC